MSYFDSFLSGALTVLWSIERQTALRDIMKKECDARSVPFVEVSLPEDWVGLVLRTDGSATQLGGTRYPWMLETGKESLHED